MSRSHALVQLRLQYEDLEALQDDLEQNLLHGRAFVSGATGVAERQPCELVVVHPESGDTFSAAAEAVWVKTDEPGLGVGLALPGLDQEGLKAFGQEKKRPAHAEPIELRVRRYTTAEQMKGAREGSLSERVALERVYGKAVWDALLQNTRITAPEVTRIARKGNVPRQLIETITANASWLGSGELRRALLTNPRLGGAALDKVLRALPKAELTIVSRQSTYPMPVRQAAKKIQGR